MTKYVMRIDNIETQKCRLDRYVDRYKRIGSYIQSSRKLCGGTYSCHQKL